MKLHLIIDTSIDPGLLLLCEGPVPIESHSLQSGKLLSRSILQELKEFLEKSKCKIQAFKSVAITTGPGSYTSLRVGASVAGSLAYGLNIPAISFSSLYSYLPEETGSFICIYPGNHGKHFILKGLKTNQRVVYYNEPTLMDEKEASKICDGVDHVITPYQENKTHPWKASHRNLRHLAEIATERFPNYSPQSPIRLLYQGLS